VSCNYKWIIIIKFNSPVSTYNYVYLYFKRFPERVFLKQVFFETYEICFKMSFLEQNF